MVARQFGVQHAPHLTRQLLQNTSASVDHRGGAGIGGPQHGPCQLHGSHAADLAVLINCHGIAKPGDVAHVDEDGRRCGRIDEAGSQLFTKQVFVADIGLQTLALEQQARLSQGATLETAQRHLHPVNKPLKAKRHKLAKRHQMVLSIAVLGLRGRRQTEIGRGSLNPRHLRTTRGHAHDCVGIPGQTISCRNPDQCGLPATGKPLLQPLPVFLRQLLRKQGQCSFGQNQQIGLHFAHLLTVPLQGGFHATIGLEFFLLRDIALQQGHMHPRFPGNWLQCADRRTFQPPSRRQYDHHQHCGNNRESPAATALDFAPGKHPLRSLPQHSRQKGSQGTNAINPQPRRIPCKQAVHMRIARGPPGETREQNAPAQFRQQPQSGPKQRLTNSTQSRPGQ